MLPEGDDERMLRAAETLLRRGVVDLTLLGAEAEVRGAAPRLGLDLSARTWSTRATRSWPSASRTSTRSGARTRASRSTRRATSSPTSSYFGTLMVALGMADGMVSGATHTTAETIRPAFELVKTRARRLARVQRVLHVPGRPRARLRRLRGQPAIRRAEQLADIAVSSAATAAQFGVEPRVAMLSYSTGESGRGRGRRPGARRPRSSCASARPELLVEGPIQYDAAVDAGVARTKLPGSDVAGRATVFIFPDLNTGNNTYKAVQRSAGAVAVGPVLQGLNKPVNDLSRGATVQDIVNTVAITAIQAQGCDGERVFVLNCGSSSRQVRAGRRGSGRRAGRRDRRAASRDHGRRSTRGLGRGRTGVRRRRRTAWSTAASASAPRCVVDDDVLAAIARAVPCSRRCTTRPTSRGSSVARRACPDVPHVAVFDTAFHHDAAAARVHLRRAARVGDAPRRPPLRLPRHLARLRLARGRAVARPSSSRTLDLIVLHLGNGASAAAVAGGRSVDTSMGLTPLEGLVMGTRSGDVDPALRRCTCARTAGLDAGRDRRRCSTPQRPARRWRGDNDMREVHRRIAAGDADAALAFDVYCYRIRKYVGAYLRGARAAPTRSSSPRGVGEHDARVRANALAGLERPRDRGRPGAQRRAG